MSLAPHQTREATFKPADPSYADKLVSLMDSYDLYRFDR